MALPRELRDKYLKRLDELIAEGESVVKRKDDGERAAGKQWGINCTSVLRSVIPHGHPVRENISMYGIYNQASTKPDEHLAQLKAIRDDFAGGFLDDPSELIEAEIASDYMGQAETLLNEGASGKFDHVPAAVLCGAVLERALRTLCERQEPALPIKLANGRSMTMDPLIDSLKKADVIKHTEVMPLKGWTAVRNKAAHGEFEEFTRKQVESMINGVRDFLGRHL